MQSRRWLSPEPGSGRGGGGADMGDGRKGLGAAQDPRRRRRLLRRLRTDRIDLYQGHYDDAQTPLEEAIGDLR